MLTPQEVNVWYVLPALRREITLSFKKNGMKQKEIAAILGVTEPAVSQYLKNKRASTIRFTEEIKKEIDTAAKNMITDKKCHRFLVQNLLTKIKKSGFLCVIHREHDNVPKCCNVCLSEDEGEIICKST
ncbi:MAG: helix-turn-helix domain-containing protein [Nanoarchaeota archaeon]|nr:helix-turn-helix domain-containing protein [Nanoarchaeota archaeon]